MPSDSPNKNNDALTTAEHVLGYQFQHRDLLVEALTHSSVVGRTQRRATQRRRPKKDRRRSNERLEFLGDRVLGLIVAHLLIEAFPDDAEGALTRRHDALVRRETLAEIAGDLGLGQLLSLAQGEIGGGGRTNPGILADCCEAVLGALYLDGGMRPAENFIRQYWSTRLNEMKNPPRDGKTALQEWAQARGLERPVYHTITSSGPAHAPTFFVEVELDANSKATGEGSSKRAAEQMAAEMLLRDLTRNKNQ